MYDINCISVITPHRTGEFVNLSNLPKLPVSIAILSHFLKSQKSGRNKVLEFIHLSQKYNPRLMEDQHLSKLKVEIV